MPAPARSTKYAPASFSPASEGGSVGPIHRARTVAVRIATGATSGRNSARRATDTGTGLGFGAGPGARAERRLDAVLGRVVVQRGRRTGGLFQHRGELLEHRGCLVGAVVDLVA